jgi:hypothetical protein
MAVARYSNLPNITDDIIIFADPVEKHDEALVRELQRLRERNPTLNRDKSEFCKTEFMFMSHILSKDGIKIDDAKNGTVRDAAPPTNVIEVKSFKVWFHSV